MPTARRRSDGVTDPNYDVRFVLGVLYFNDCDFFEAHEAWEDLWTEYQGPSRRFYQGLIQVAVCLHHFGNGNTRGARKLYHGATGYLAQYGEFYEGVNVQQLCDDLRTCCREIIDCEDDYPSCKIVADLIPEIHLDPPASPEIRLPDRDDDS